MSRTIALQGSTWDDETWEDVFARRRVTSAVLEANPTIIATPTARALQSESSPSPELKALLEQAAAAQERSAKKALGLIDSDDLPGACKEMARGASEARALLFGPDGFTRDHEAEALEPDPGDDEVSGAGS